MAVLCCAEDRYSHGRGFFENNLGDGYEDWHIFYEFHKLAYDERETFDYEEVKKNNYQVKTLGEVELGEEPLK